MDAEWFTILHHRAGLRIPEYSSFNNDAMNLQKSWQKFCDAFVYISHDINMYSWITRGGGVLLFASVYCFTCKCICITKPNIFFIPLIKLLQFLALSWIRCLYYCFLSCVNTLVTRESKLCVMVQPRSLNESVYLINTFNQVISRVWVTRLWLQ